MFTFQLKKQARKAQEESPTEMRWHCKDVQIENGDELIGIVAVGTESNQHHASD